MPPLTAQDQIYLKKYIGPNYAKYNSILRGRTDKLFTNDNGSVDRARLATLFAEFGGFRGLLTDTIGIVAALAKIPVFTGSSLASRGVNDFKVNGGAKLTFTMKQLFFSQKPYKEPAFMSTTAGKCMWPKDVLIAIDLTTSTKHGGRKLTAEHGAYTNEDECLFLPAAPFRVKKIETFSWGTHKQYINEREVDVQKAKAFKHVVLLEAMDYPAAELNPVTSTWYQAAKQLIGGYETTGRSDLLALARAGGEFSPDTIETASLRADAERLISRSMLDMQLQYAMITREEHARALTDHHLTDLELANIR